MNLFASGELKTKVRKIEICTFLSMFLCMCLRVLKVYYIMKARIIMPQLSSHCEIAKCAAEVF